jgi:putative transposase
VILAHKIALDPNQDQASYFAKACGISRFAWNWALSEWNRQYAEWREYRCGPRPSEGSLRRELNEMKADAFPWMLEVTKNAPQQAIKNVGTAFKNYFSDLKKPKKQRHFRRPKFKKKGKSNDSFRADNGTDKHHPNAVDVDGKRIKLPVIGWIRMREEVRFKGNIKSVTVSRVADRWFASISVEVAHVPPVRENQAVGGVDLGIKAMATLSDGSVIDGPKALRSNLKRLRRLSRSHSRKVKKSANRRKSARKLAKLHARIANIRRDALHQATTDVVRRFDVVGIEDLNVRGMLANDKLSRAVADVGMSEFRRQIEYKAPMQGAIVVVASRWYPSSKTCSDCGYIRAKLGLNEREWSCDGCGAVHDRDHNAAKNLRFVAESSLAAASPAKAGSVTVCGATSSGFGLPAEVKLVAAKQKPTHGLFVHV